MTLSASLAQHPVGQGGLMSGRLSVPGGQFHWIFDCGSNQSDSLKTEIASLARHGVVDCLFLSHLDSDHINGVDRLLATVQGVDEVVLPYLDNLDRLAAVARDLSESTLTGTFLDFVRDTPGWFERRGVRRLTFIMPGTDDDGPAGPLPDTPGDPGVGEGQIKSKWLYPVQSPQFTTPPHRISVQTLPITSVLALMTPGRSLDWIFVPYAHHPSKNQLLEFRRALFREFGRHYGSNSFVADVIRNQQKREKLRSAYDLVWTNHNHVSMSLYAGPLSSTRWRTSSGQHLRYWHFGQQDTVGWLCTGDMDLKSRVRREAFLAHYRPFLDQVNVFCLPHHGSHLNFHRHLLDALPNLKQCVAASGPNGYGHPHAAVIDAVFAADREFIHVTEMSNTRLFWRHQR